MAPDRLRKRAEFLAARKGRRLNGPFFFVEAHERGDDAAPRIGLTITKKVGGAVERNRIRRRLREAIRLGAEADMAPGFDYVVVARRELLGLPFETLKGELSRRFARTGKDAPPARSARPDDRGQGGAEAGSDGPHRDKRRRS